jgi:hypothetical protein
VRGWLLPILQHVKIFTVDEAFAMSGTRGLECCMPAIRRGMFGERLLVLLTAAHLDTGACVMPALDVAS